MQTLYGIKITDRVTVSEYVMGSAKTFGAFFDGQPVGKIETSGAAAVRGAISFLQERAQQRERDQKLMAEIEAQNQIDKDHDFLWNLAQKLNIDKDDLDTLIEIANRRK